jgi:hypothetical protein
MNVVNTQFFKVTIEWLTTTSTEYYSDQLSVDYAIDTINAHFPDSRITVEQVNMKTITRS